MPVYLPVSAIGNGRVLATLGGAGEVMTFFYPRLDFAQNVQECLPLLYLGDPGHGRLLWTFDAAFNRTQEYLPDTNIVQTTLELDNPALRIVLTDFCPPESTAIVRCVRLENLSGAQFSGSFGHYFDLRLGEVYGKQAVGYDWSGGYFLQYFRGIAVAVGGTAPDVWRCGKSIAYDTRSAKQDLEDGYLNGQSEDIGRVNFSSLHHLNLAPGQTDEFSIIIVAGPSREEAVEQLQVLTVRGGQALLDETAAYWHNWLARCRTLDLPEALRQPYHRAVLTLPLLQDATTGSFIAAPEFDPAYERCGGYGYCWPRDASESAEALSEAGYPDTLDRLCEWYRTAQLPNGMWGQRHWADGQVAASWALRKGFEQLDQTAAALISVCKQVIDATESERESHLNRYWDTIASAVGALETHVTAEGLHRHACDLWETYCGVFLYTNAAFARAFKLAAQCAQLAGHPTLKKRWTATAARIKAATKAFFNGTYFPRGLREDGHLDDVVDSSTLGLVEPWQLLSPDDPEDRAMILSNLAEIERRLGHPFGNRLGLMRHEGDGYLGGVVGCVNTLWGAQVYLRLAAAQQQANPAAAAGWRRQALDYITVALDHATASGLLPELIGLHPDTPYWAAPHGWASALLIRCALLLDATAGLE
jgi:oligosaccharide amylase